MTATECSQVDQERNKLIILGDLLIDRTYYVQVSKLSPEAPVPVAMLTGQPVDTPGGAGLAAAFSSRDKIPSIFATYTSNKIASDLAEQYSIPTILYHQEGTIQNCIKTRYIDQDSHYHLIRVDNDKTVPDPFVHGGEEEWISSVKLSLETENVGCLMILDYRKGLLSEDRSQRLITIANKLNIPVYIDSRSKNLHKFRRCNILKLNKVEFNNACHNLNCYSNNTPNPWALISTLNLSKLIITLGAEGAELYSADSEFYKIIPQTHEGSPDVTGCGDVFDTSFCYNYFIKKQGIKKSLENAVNRATKYAYESLGERLKCQN